MKRKKRRRIYGDLFVYFITFVTAHRFPYLQVSTFRDVLEEDILFAKLIYRFHLYGYAIMHEHIHLMIQPHGNHTYPAIVAAIKRNSTRDINALARGLPFMRTAKSKNKLSNELILNENYALTNMKHPHISEDAYDAHFMRLSMIRDVHNSGRTSRMYTRFRWQSSFHDHVVRDERDYYNHLRYLWRNPVKHGLAASSQDWNHLWVEGRSHCAPGNHLFTHKCDNLLSSST